MKGRRASLLAWFIPLVAVLLMVARPAAAADTYKVAPGDTLVVKVAGEPEYTKSYTINDEGRIAVPNIGEMRVAGRTVDQVKADLISRLKVYLRNPDVSVDLPNPVGNTVWISGEVRSPGEIKIKQGAQLMEVIQKAGGLTDTADKTRAKLQRRGEEQSRSLDLKALYDDVDLSKNIEVAAGDTIFIPKTAAASKKVEGKIKIVGEVSSPGDKDLKDNLTVMEAVNLAGGFTATADRTEVTLERKDGTKKSLNLDAAARGESVPELDGLVMQEGDVIRVYNNKDNQITVSGPGVKTQGTFPWETGMTVMSAILQKAGGFNERARQDNIQVVRKNGTAMTLSYNRFVKGDSAQNPALEKGDIINVEQGDVKGPKQVNPILNTLLGTIGSALLFRSLYRN